MSRLARLLQWLGRSPAVGTSFPPGHVPPKAMPAPAVRNSVLDGMYFGAMYIGADEVDLMLNDGRRLRITRADVPMVRAALESLDRTASGLESPSSDLASSGACASGRSEQQPQAPASRS